ncbi:MAG: 4Fe-4S dicluster domain-containing protein [Chloroflexota bacterium]
MCANRTLTLYEQVTRATPGGHLLDRCLQCGTCGGSCPSGGDMQYTPREIFAMLRAGMDDEVLRSNTAWYCVSCYACTVRCPQGIPITDLMYTIKQKAIAAGCYDQRAAAKFSETFIGFVEQRGRSFEFGLATRFHLFHHPLQTVRLGVMGLNMIRHNRLALRPKSIRQTGQLNAILSKAKELAEKETRV